MTSETTRGSHLKSVLIVDDVPDNLRLLTSILREHGYKARPAPNGRLALRAATNDPPDLILLDVDMPEMDGFDVCRKLKAAARTRDIPVIFVSAIDDVANRVKGFEAGGVDYIGKPFQPGEVLARLHTHLSLRALQQQLETQNVRLREQAEALGEANDQLARAVRLKDEFLASVSHELRTPLNAILGISEVLTEGIYGSLNEKQRRSIQVIEESGRHLLNLINDILDVSKIEAGKMELQMAPVSVEAVCRASLQLIGSHAAEKRLHVSWGIDSSVTTIWADERRLKQILTNLLSNAVKFTPEDGKIGLEVSGEANREVLRFMVWDTGIGIPEEEMGRLFQPFVQLDSRLSRQYSGTGLGLALVHRLTDMHGGSLSVQSQVGEGSRFIVSLPWKTHSPTMSVSTAGEDSTQVIPEYAIASAAEPSATILLADDNESSIAVARDYLTAHGYHVIVARNGIEAMERAKQERPNLVLMDIQMPEMDGLEAIRQLRQLDDPAAHSQSDVADTPIVALTALAMPGDRERCLAAGADDYISKPVSLKELVATIRAHLGSGEET
jgi:signal transduction histidine kinase